MVSADNEASADAAAADTADNSVDDTDPVPAATVDATQAACAEFHINTCSFAGLGADTSFIESRTNADKALLTVFMRTT